MTKIGSVLAAVVALACVLPSSSCGLFTSSDPAPAPPTASTPTVSSETSLERRTRLDQQAAVKAYRTAFAESTRIYMAGGEGGMTQLMKSVATGSYLELTQAGISLARRHRWRLSQSAVVTYVAAQGWSASTVHVKACEDGTRARLLDEAGNDRTFKGERRYVQDYTVSKTATGWKVADVSTTKVKTFKTAGCSNR